MRDHLPFPTPAAAQPHRYRLLILAIIVLVLMLIVEAGVIGYFWGLQRGLNSIPDELVSSPIPTATPSANLPETEFPSSTGSTYPRKKVSITDELRQGYSTGPSNPDLEVFVFADLTEEGFSGRTLTENIADLRQKYPDQLRIWYLHTVLPYRDNPSLRVAIASLYCLNQQNRVWENMADLVRENGDSSYRYDVSSREEYVTCLTEINQNETYFDQTVHGSQVRMSMFSVTGVPTTIFVRPSDNEAVIVPGALPRDIFAADAKKIIESLID